ncbi:uncharacterized protein LOC118187504 [Stegodyphus dumicola]|uniref:uncharacterized protein LOC118187504 n=1 Tax=Stegodyphus dumicola TaxID=202533 RepID=UPI0015AA68DA|nr:uncharacterized protein LOC118187504 [Stegodyphus dumicola]
MGLFFGMYMKQFLWIMTLYIARGQSTQSTDVSSLHRTLAEEKVDDFMMKLHLNLEDIRIQRIGSVFERNGRIFLLSLSSNVTELTFNSSDSITAWYSVNVNETELIFGGTTDGKITIFWNFKLVLLNSPLSRHKIIDLQAFCNEYGLWLVAMYQQRKENYFIQVYDYNNLSINKKMQINLKGLSFISIAKAKKRNFLLIASMTPSDIVLQLYEWMNTQFDLLSTTELQGNAVIKSSAMWDIDGLIYVAISLGIRNYVRIMRCSNFETGKLILIQLIDNSPHIIKYFKVAGNHYMIHGLNETVIIYWWNGVKFLKQQEFKTSSLKDVVDISVIELYWTVPVIAIATDNSVEYFVQKYSYLYEQISFTDFSNFGELKSIILWKNETDLYLLPVLKNLHPPVLVKLQLDLQNLESALTEKEPECIIGIETLLNKKTKIIDDISSKMVNVWQKNNSMALPSVVINGTVTINEAVPEKIGITNEKTAIGITQKIFNLYRVLQNQSTIIFNTLNKAVLKSGYQQIKTNLRFEKEMKINGTIAELTISLINGINTSVLKSALKLGKGQQTCLSNMTVTSVNAKDIEVTFLNSKSVNDFVNLKKNVQTMKGNLSFMDLRAGSLRILDDYTLNGLELGHLVLASSPQEIIHKKCFDNLTAKNINSVGGAKLIQVIKDAVYLNTEILTMPLTFLSNITVLANITAKTINKMNITDFVEKGIKKVGDEDIKGTKNFFKLFSIRENLTLDGLVNKINVSQLMLLKLSQILLGNMKFNHILFNSVEVNLLNRIELKHDVVKRLENSSVNGSVHFMETVYVSHIAMKDEGLINNISLTSIASNILTSKDAEFKNDITIGNINVTHNVGIENDMHNLKNLTRNVLQKKYQNFSDGYFETFSVKHLLVKFLNNIPLNEFLSMKSVNILNASKSFQDVHAGSIKLAKNKTINGFDPSSEVLHNILLNDISLQNMRVGGNLTVFNIMNINISDLMKVQEMSTCSGIKHFKEAELHSLTANKLSFSQLNSKNFTHYLDNSILLSPRKFILNKWFEHLEGDQIDDQVLVKNIRILQEAVVTLDTHQIIHEKMTFTNHLKLKSLLVIDLNGINLSDVVLKDVADNIPSVKVFKGFLWADDTQVDKVNNIDIENLQLHAFKKNQNNTIFETFTFESLLNVTAIQIGRNISVDGVKLESLIYLNEDVSLRNLRLTRTYAKNVNISGYINECDLLQILNNSVYLKNNQIFITSKKSLKSLTIDGHLHVKNVLNGITEDEFVKISGSLNSQYDMNINFVNINAEKLFLLHRINGVEIGFLLEDAVLKDIFQNITGLKIFHKLHSNTLSIRNLKVSSTLCEIKVHPFFKTSVMKTSKQKFFLSRMPKIVARNVTVKGLLNSVQLLNDVVLTYTDDSVLSPVYFNISNMSSLTVLGDINGISLINFLAQRVSLSLTEELFSTVIFEQSLIVEGQTHIKGNLNSVNFTEIAYGKSSINGSKIFRNELFLDSNLNVIIAINETNLELLVANLLKICSEERINDSVEFHSLNVSDLVFQIINEVPIKFSWNYILDLEKNIPAVLDDLIFELDSNQQSLQHLDGEIGNISPIFVFFELHQLLHLGQTERFLSVFTPGRIGNAYEQFTVQIIIWVQKNKNCSAIRSLIMDIHENGTLYETKRINERVYPFSLQMLNEKAIGFSLHVDRTHRCVKKKLNSTIIKTLFLNGEINFNKLLSPINATVLDAKLLESIDEILILIAFNFEGNEEKIYLYRYESGSDSWSFHQKFFSHNPTALDVTFLKDQNTPSIYLAITVNDDVSGLYIYEFDFDKSIFSLKINSSNAVSSSVLWVDNELDVFLLLAKEKTKILKNSKWVDVYTQPLEGIRSLR